MSRMASPSSGKPCGVAMVCLIWRVALATVYRHRAPARPARPTLPRRPGPTRPITDADLVEEIRHALQRSPFHGEGHRKVWTRLRIAGIRTSQRRVLRMMRENALLAPSRTGLPRGPRARDGIIIPDTVDVMWGTDLTIIFTGHGHVAVLSPRIITRPNALLFPLCNQETLASPCGAAPLCATPRRHGMIGPR